jgi:hypothetical protein
MSWAAARRSSTRTASWSTAPAPTGSCKVYAETGDLKAVVDSLVRETEGRRSNAGLSVNGRMTMEETFMIPDPR